MSIRCVLRFALVALLTAHMGRAATFYVAPGGNDAWSGTRPAPNEAKTDGPLATLARARDLVRALKRRQGGALTRPVTVFLRGGRYELSEPAVFGPADSGTAACPVVYAAFEKEVPVLSGGRLLGGWRQDEEGVYVTAIPAVREGKWTFRQLFVARAGQGHFERRYRPSKGPFIIAGLTDSPVWKTRMRHRQSQKDFIFKPGDIDATWANLADVEVVALHDWSSSRLRIEAVDAAKHVVRFTGYPVYRIGHWYRNGANPYYVENVKEAFGRPGEFYLDRPTGLLSYRPMPGEDVSKLVVVAPRVEQLLRLVGEPAKVTVRDESDTTVTVTEPEFVEHVHFRGLTFRHTWWGLPAKGYSSGQGMVDLPAAVHAELARHCRFERCTLAHLGAYALRLGEGCHDNAVVGCRMFDLGAGGVLVGSTNRTADPPFLPTGNVVSNCVISDGGLVHFSPHGIWVGITRGTVVRHTVVRRFPYSNVSVGWSWNDQPTSARETLLEANHIHDAMMLLADGGGIYSLGFQPGSVWRGNHIHHVRRSRFAGRAPNNAIFFDQGSKGFLLDGNVIHTTVQAPIRFNQCRKEWHTWKNNVIGIAPDDPSFPEHAKAIVARAGLEPAFRDLEPTPKVNPLPLLSMKLPPPPPPPPPKPIADGFETTRVGRRPRMAGLSALGKGASIAVTDETAATGRRCLKIADAPGLTKPFHPYLYYTPKFARGVATVSLALRVEQGASLSLEGRQKTHVATAVRVSVAGDGTLAAGRKARLKLPLGQWVRLDFAFRLGKQDDGTYDLAVTLPGKAPQRLEKLSARGCRRLGTFMVCSHATDSTVFYIDDIRMTPSPVDR